MTRTKINKLLILLYFLAFSGAFGGMAHAGTSLGAAQVDSGETAANVLYFEDRTNAGSVIQAVTQFERLRAANRVHLTRAVDLGSAGGTFWIALPVTNNSATERWNLEFVPFSRSIPSPVKSVAIFDPSTPDKPILSWPNSAYELSPLSLPMTFDTVKTTTRYALVETWPGIRNPVTPTLKTAEYVANNATDLARKISLLWLVTGAVFGAGLVQLIMTRQMLQGMLAINALILGGGVFILQRSELVPALASHHPLFLPLAVNSFLGIGASLMLWVASQRYSIKATMNFIPFSVNVIALFGAMFYLDVGLGYAGAFGITLEKAPHILLSVTGIMLTLATVSITMNHYGLAWFIPGWTALAAMPWLGDFIPFGSAVIYAVMLAVAGVASVFSMWRAADQEVQSTQKRLRQDMKDLKEQHASENQAWEKKLESERTLLNELRHREQQRSAELEIARREADTANKAKGDFLAIISHEIRTPMNGIMGVIELIRQSPLNDKQQEYVDVIKNSGDTMLTLLNDILDYSKIEKGAIDLEDIPFNLRSLVSSVATLMSGRAKEKGLAIDFRISDDIPNNLIGDPNRIRQVLLNLVGNAIKFTEKGRVTITVQHKRTQDADEYGGKTPLLFEVMDTGIGIPRETQDKLFQPYVQADASISRRYGGTGLGLNICRMLVGAMKGEIGLVSTPNVGSTFWFVLPLGVDEHQGDMLAAAPAKPVTPLRILLIDDNPINIKVMTGLLELDAHEVTSADSGEKALQILDGKKVHFDVILVDIMMPGMDGKTFISHVRAHKRPSRSTLPIFALTGLTEPEEIAHIKKLGVEGVLTKPVSQNALRTALAPIPRTDAAPEQAAVVTPDTLVSNVEKLSAEEKARLRALLNDAPAPPAKADEAPSPSVEKKTIAPEPPPAVTIEPVMATPSVVETRPIPPAPPSKPAQAYTMLNMTMLNELRASLPRETLDDIFKDLVEKSAELLDQINEAFRADDMDDMAEKAHNLKGMAGNFGMDALMKHCAILEQAGRRNEKEKAAKQVPLGRQIFNDTMDQFKSWSASS